MHIDMHYYGTYALARAAGLEREAAQVVATSAQFVDDNVSQVDLDFRDGSHIGTEATAHRLMDYNNLIAADQRRVWVPFHFLPGNVGVTYTERLKCRADSEVAREMRDHHLAYRACDFSLQLLGIAAHVYADTFSHYGFSGVSSRGNRVHNDSFRYQNEARGLDAPVAELSPDMQRYVTRKAERYFEEKGEHGGLLTNINSWFGEQFSGALGHGSVATLPDRPYLVWSFEYERHDAVAGLQATRNNPLTYLDACRALHQMFKRFVNLHNEFRDSDGQEFETIRGRIWEILLTQDEEAGRIATWNEAARSGELFGGRSEEIPDYDGENWTAEWEALNGAEDSQIAIDNPIRRFYQAAFLHRTYVLRYLLPKHGLFVGSVPDGR